MTTAEHLAGHTLDRYLRRTLPPDEHLQARRHLRTCVRSRN